MTNRLKNLSQEARKLPAAERAALVDDLLSSLDSPDDHIDKLWAEEAEQRLNAVDSGAMPVRDAADTLADLRVRRGE